MAFDKKYKNSGDSLCPICRRTYTEGRSIIEGAYHKGTGTMCKDCMNRYYRNHKTGRTAADTDDPVNFLVRLRPAQILEKPRLLQKAEPPCGYEYVMPELCAQQIIQDLVIWVVLCLTIGLLGGKGSVEHISMLIMGIVLTFISLFWAMYDLFRLIKGILFGMGHIRRVLLLVSVLVKLLLAWNFFPLYLFDH